MNQKIYALTIGAICLGYIVGVIHEYHRNNRKKCSGWFLVAIAGGLACLILTQSP